MLKERLEFIRNILYLAELALVSIVFFALHYFFLHHQAVYKLDLLPSVLVARQPESIDQYLRAYWLVLAVWAVLLKVRGGHHHFRTLTHRKLLLDHLVNGLIFFVAFAGGAFLLKFDFLSRSFMVIYTVVSVVSLFTMRSITLSAANRMRSRGYNYRNLLVVGTGRRTQQFLKLIEKHREWGYRILGLLDQEREIVGKEVGGYKVLGVLDDLPAILESNVVDQVVFVVPRSWLEKIEKCILYCEAVGVPVTLSTDFFELEVASGVPQEMDGFTYITFETPLLKEPELFVKRTLDIIASAAVLAVMSPVFLAVGIAVKMTSDGPVFFKQIRCGRNGRKFVLYKFRSMVPDAEARLEELRSLNEQEGPVFKIANDPRLTNIGKFLRKTSLDEFPQFWNVLKGDMSLVGPRPPLPSEVSKYKPWQRRRLSMKPGITCIWQVSGRNNVNFHDWMKMDLDYIDRWSLWLDLRILLQTVRVVLTGHGAR